jgi:tetratricopeptide (TPR) repeat protein
MANFVRSTVEWVKRPFRRSPVGRRTRTTFPSLIRRGWGTVPSYLPFYILVPVLAYALWYGWQPATVIAPFHLPPENKDHPVPFSGEAVADVLQDAIRSIEQEAEGQPLAPPCDSLAQKDREFAGLRAAAGSSFQVRGPVTVEVKGISPEAVVSAARQVLRREKYISGDVVLSTPNAFELMAQANDGGPWMTKPQGISPEGLKWASCELAERILGATNKNVLAAAWIRRGKNDDVIKLYGSLSSRADPDSLNNLGVAIRMKCATPGTLASSEPQRECLEDAVAKFHQALTRRWNFPEAHYNLGVALRNVGRNEAAIFHYHMAIEMNPDYAMAYNNLGNALDDKGEYDDAIAEYRKAIELNPDDPMTHNNLGTALSGKGQIDAAIAEYRKALQLTSDALFNAYPHYNLGLALRKQGHTDDAIAEFRKAIELKPDDAAAHNNLGSALNEQGQTDEAIAEFRKAIELKPDLQLARDNLAAALASKSH